MPEQTHEYLESVTGSVSILECYCTTAVGKSLQDLGLVKEAILEMH
jgi:hypothetical protein